ncbi:MAG: hypothetical protein AUK44_00830 [Porphyromonadaceae bacterium CG2_30_38_12]|nr:MAG: hypothetical protein AUK44_00830 [Porphyromonadaceae bacterium CG2_30_38_12]
MDFKKFWKESLGGFILKHLLLAAGMLLVLSWGILYLIDIYTQHGKTEHVPDLRGMYVEEAQLMLSNHSLYTEIIDSVYVKDKKLGTIIEQIPAANSNVKRNRPVYIIVNSRQLRRVPLPEVNDVSYRQADAMLRAIGIHVSNVVYTPSEYKDLVIDVTYGGQSIAPGYRIPEGSYVSLVVGSGTPGEDILVPLLKSLALEDARQQVLTDSMVIGAIDYDVPPRGNEASYFVYRQRPAAGKMVPAGTRIDIWLTRDKAMLEKTFEEDKKDSQTDEQFF